MGWFDWLWGPPPAKHWYSLETRFWGAPTTYENPRYLTANAALEWYLDQREAEPKATSVAKMQWSGSSWKYV